MEHTSHLILSDYQRAILNEMGVSSWQLIDSDKDSGQNKPDIQAADPVDNSSALISKEDALSKLKQLKAQTHTDTRPQAAETTQSVLMTLPLEQAESDIATDVFIVLGLDGTQKKQIGVGQVSDYSGYPLSWELGENVSFNDKQLITPPISEFGNAEIKKQLWQQLQKALPVAKHE